MSVPRLRLAPVGETVFRPRGPFSDPVEEPPVPPHPLQALIGQWSAYEHP